ncbi:Avirulence (Avh) protein [Phytophthora megakarya]|uniref:Avirulence (Avh) protein n=1 Tax=Phytophthora megakarya TaxID=4795 RepID=A0A225VE91_9STRA|nr:Avirulence (Avh) protein [Phytophthora megakarya]
MALRISPQYQELAQSIWLKGRTDPKVIFQALDLGGTLLKLDDNPRVLQWFKYVKAYNVAGKRKGVQFSDDDIYQLLSKNTDNGELAVLFYSLKSNPAFKSLGESMAKVVFNDWLRKEVRPEKVMIQLELIGNRASDIPDHTLRSKIHRDYVFMFTNELNLRAYYKTQLDKLFG